MKEQIEELTEKYENAKRKKNQYESLANKSSLLKSSIEDIEKEKKALQEEREQSRLMMNEILAMKHQMELERQELEKSKAQLSNKEEDSIFESTYKD